MLWLLNLHGRGLFFSTSIDGREQSVYYIAEPTTHRTALKPTTATTTSYLVPIMHTTSHKIANPPREPLCVATQEGEKEV